MPGACTQRQPGPAGTEEKPGAERCERDPLTWWSRRAGDSHGLARSKIVLAWCGGCRASRSLRTLAGSG
jgi:hypothetical protein